MNRQVVVRMVATLAVGMFGMLGDLAGQVSGQHARRVAATPSRVPRTANRHPNFEGTWAYGTATPLERPAQFSDKPFFVSDAEAEQFLKQSQSDRRAVQASRLGVPEFVEPDWPFVTIAGRKPTSVIFEPSDGRIPYIAPDMQQRPIEERLDKPEDVPLSERCLRALAGPPILPNVGLLYVQIFQTSDDVVLSQEDLHDARIVPLDGRSHVSGQIRTWLGDSRGRWDGDTLIVDTTNFRDQLHQRGPSYRFDRNLRVVERLTLVSSDTLWYEFTVEDPTLFTRPWSGRFPMRKTGEPIFEVACHEGNYAMFNMLRGARVQEGVGATSR